ncbi:transposase [bacterium]|nr:transposase [bacterium]
MMNKYLSEFGKHYSTKKLFVISDQAGWHKSIDLEVPQNIELLYLPPYSPELNPEERLWLWLRRHVCKNRVVESLMDELSFALQNMTKEKISALCKCSYLL